MEISAVVSSESAPPPTSISGLSQVGRILFPIDHDEPSRVSSPVETGSFRDLAVNELLFSEGQPKTHFYLVKSGILGVYEPRWNGHHAVLEYAFPGDLVGFGFLQSHTCSARATVEARVQCFASNAQIDLIQGASRAEARLADAVEREFEFLRNSLIRSGRKPPLERVAAFLLVLSNENKHEGRDPAVLTQSLQCGIVADLLALSVDELASLLVNLERRGWIEPCPPQGLRLNDVVALERLVGRSSVCQETRPPALHAWSGFA